MRKVLGQNKLKSFSVFKIYPNKSAKATTFFVLWYTCKEI